MLHMWEPWLSLSNRLGNAYWVKIHLRILTCDGKNQNIKLNAGPHFGFYRHTLVSLSGSSLHTHCQVCLTDSTAAPTCVALGPTIKGVLWIRLGSSVHVQAIPCWWAQTRAKQLSMAYFWTVVAQVSWLWTTWRDYYFIRLRVLYPKATLV